MSALAAVQIKRRQLCIEDEDWRDLVERVTGQRSTRDLKPGQLRDLLAELDRLAGGRETASGHRRKQLQGPYAPKLQALWISCWNLGLVASRDDKALIGFVRRQTHIDHPNWVVTPEDALKAIEAMKAMLARRGVRWSFGKLSPDYIRRPGYQITRAQFALVGSPAQSFDGWVADQAGKPVDQMGHEDWIPLMNRLGRLVRIAVRTGQIEAGAAE